jgi:hypothetical protein
MKKTNEITHSRLKMAIKITIWKNELVEII